MSVTPQSLKDEGLAALKSGDLKLAIDRLSKAVLLDHNDAGAKILLGMAYSQNGMHAQAVRAVQTSVELEPKNADYRYNLGVVLEAANDPTGALHAYRDATQLNKDHGAAKAKLQALAQALGPQVNQLLNGPRPQSASAPPFAPPPQSSIPGGEKKDADGAATVQCEACHKQTAVSMICQHCLAPLPPPPAPKPVSPSQIRAAAPKKSQIKLPPHRAGTIMALGVGSFFIPFLAIAAISMGGIDMVIMERNEMDNSGYKMTEMGRKLGFVSLGLWGLAIVVVFILPAILRMYGVGVEKKSSGPVAPPARVAVHAAGHHLPRAS